MEPTTTRYMGLACLRLENEQSELIVATGVGPRVLRFALHGAENGFGEFPQESTKTALGDWKPYAGHRLWASPELFPGTYAPDNEPVEHEAAGNAAQGATIHLRRQVDAASVGKEIAVTLHPSQARATVTHTLTNRGMMPVTMAPWAISIFRGGVAVIPREPYRSHDQCVAIAQPLGLYHFTDLQDARYTLGTRYILMRADAASPSPQKIALRNKRGWCAHVCPSSVLIKTFTYVDAGRYPDYDSNTEAYVAGDYMEIELLGELRTLDPGAAATLTEHWALFPGLHNEAMRDEDTLHAALKPLLAQIAPASA